ncbi:hypothetical protein TNCV_4522361 [Trichonephila clavipes]|nr:hypothetical protein TNCV_4522361 [Trichonephila clavipes]
MVLGGSLPQINLGVQGVTKGPKSNAVFARRRIELKQELKLLDIRAELEREREKQRRRTREVREQALPSENDRQSYL